MQVWPAPTIRLHLAVALALAATPVIAALFAGLPWELAGIGAVFGALWYPWRAGRFHHRRALIARPFPEQWRQVLSRRVPFYRALSEGSAGRRRFEDDVRIFLDEQNIYGVGQDQEQYEVGEETRLLIAASAAMLGHGMPNFEWPRMRDIVVYPRAFDEDYQREGSADIAGMVHHQGPILYSERDLQRGFRHRDGHNVGLHELAHVLDLADGYADGVPVGASWATNAPWFEIVSDRLALLRKRHHPDLLREYAATNEAEFFAVAVESFFECPERLRGRDPELYAMLVAYFGQDPADVG